MALVELYARTYCGELLLQPLVNIAALLGSFVIEKQLKSGGELQRQDSATVDSKQGDKQFVIVWLKVCISEWCAMYG